MPALLTSLDPPRRRRRRRPPRREPPPRRSRRPPESELSSHPPPSSCAARAAPSASRSKTRSGSLARRAGGRSRARSRSAAPVTIAIWPSSAPTAARYTRPACPAYTFRRVRVEAVIAGAESPYAVTPPPTSRSGVAARGRLLRLLRHAAVDRDQVDGLGVASYTLAPIAAIDLAWKLGLRIRWPM